MNKKVLSALIALLGGFIGAIIQKKTNNDNNSLKYITEERKKWRDDIRNIAEELYKSNPNYTLIKAKLKIRLNPIDKNDNEIIEKMDELICNNYSSQCKDDVLEMISRLLKHDWERAKLEANKNKFFPYGAIILILITFSILIQAIFFNTFKEIKVLQFIKNLIDIRIVFYILSTIFIMGWIIIVFKIILSFTYVNKYVFLKYVLKTFEIPFRENKLKK